MTYALIYLVFISLFFCLFINSIVYLFKKQKNKKNRKKMFSEDVKYQAIPPGYEIKNIKIVTLKQDYLFF